jgi:hypothetical protein
LRFQRRHPRYLNRIGDVKLGKRSQKIGPCSQEAFHVGVHIELYIVKLLGIWKRDCDTVAKYHAHCRANGLD